MSKLERELENVNDLLAAARQRGKNKIEKKCLQSVSNHSFLEEFESFITELIIFGFVVDVTFAHLHVFYLKFH